MQTPDIFEQIAHGMGDPKKFSQWLKETWPISADGKAGAAQTRAWIGSLQSLLQGAEALRHLQLEAIRKTQKRTSRLAKSLDDAHNPADTATALQAFALENMQDAPLYWSVYQEIVQDAELHMLNCAGEPTRIKGVEPHGKTRTPSRHQKPAHAA